MPKSFMKSVIMLVVKNKCGDLADLNNYRAIAVSTSVSQLFECIVLTSLQSNSDFDQFQFGFKSGHSSSFCTSINKQLIITGRGEAMCSVALWTTTRPLTMSTLGSCS